jgi:hypothetical protein
VIVYSVRSLAICCVVPLPAPPANGVCEFWRWVLFVWCCLGSGCGETLFEFIVDRKLALSSCLGNISETGSPSYLECEQAPESQFPLGILVVVLCWKRIGSHRCRSSRTDNRSSHLSAGFRTVASFAKGGYWQHPPCPTVPRWSEQLQNLGRYRSAFRSEIIPLCMLSVTRQQVGSSGGKKRSAGPRGWRRALVANSLCRGQEKRTMRESEVQIENSGLLARRLVFEFS